MIDFDGLDGVVTDDQPRRAITPARIPITPLPPPLVPKRELSPARRRGWLALAPAALAAAFAVGLPKREAPRPAVAIAKPAPRWRELRHQRIDLPLRFPFNRTRPSADPAALAEAIGRLKKCHGVIVVTGHTCAIGNELGNLEVGLARARAAAQLLAEAGVDPSRLQLESAGSVEPLAPNDTREGRRVNRRATVRCALDEEEGGR